MFSLGNNCGGCGSGCGGDNGCGNNCGGFGNDLCSIIVPLLIISGLSNCFCNNDGGSCGNGCGNVCGNNCGCGGCGCN